MEYDFLLPVNGNTDKVKSTYHETTFAQPKKFVNLICNQSKTNELIGKRNFICKLEHVFDPRPEMTGLCLDGQIQREQLQPDSTENYLLPNFVNCNEHPLCPDKMDAKRYFLNIDVESRLKNIDYFDTRCKEDIYKNDPDCKDCSLVCHQGILKNDSNVPYPDRKRTECVVSHQFPNITNNRNNPNIFIRKKQDTVYDFSNHKVCKISPERVWNNFTKRNMQDPTCN